MSSFNDLFNFKPKKIPGHFDHVQVLLYRFKRKTFH